MHRDLNARSPEGQTILEKHVQIRVLDHDDIGDTLLLIRLISDVAICKERMGKVEIKAPVLIQGLIGIVYLLFLHEKEKAIRLSKAVHLVDVRQSVLHLGTHRFEKEHGRLGELLLRRNDVVEKDVLII